MILPILPGNIASVTVLRSLLARPAYLIRLALITTRSMTNAAMPLILIPPPLVQRPSSFRRIPAAANTAVIAIPQLILMLPATARRSKARPAPMKAEQGTRPVSARLRQPIPVMDVKAIMPLLADRFAANTMRTTAVTAPITITVTDAPNIGMTVHLNVKHPIPITAATVMPFLHLMAASNITATASPSVKLLTATIAETARR